VSDVRVLIVDDQETYLRAMAAVVGETEGFVVVGSATTGEASLTASADLLPDLVLMDVNLPGIDGIEATRRLQASPHPPAVMLLSTYAEDDFELEGCGAAGYVAKAALGPDRLMDVWAAAGRADEERRSVGRQPNHE
jgi:DNA-binding NarL/FixJ family response regulator